MLKWLRSICLSIMTTGLVIVGLTFSQASFSAQKVFLDCGLQGVFQCDALQGIILVDDEEDPCVDETDDGVDDCATEDEVPTELT